MLKIKRIRTLLNIEKCTLKTELRKLKILLTQHGTPLPPKIKQNRKQKTNKQKQNEKQGGEWKCLRKMV